MNITINALKKVYPRNIFALHGLDLQIGTGMFGLLGPNGAGKTTLMRILATLIRPTSGSASVNGHRTDDPQGKWAIRGMLGYLPQELALYGDLSAREFLEFIAALKEIPVRERKQRIDTALDTTGLTDVAKRRLRGYSGGMKRRVGVAQALLGDPKLLIVDEPTVGLDPQERVRFRNLLVGLAADRTVILSTHIIEDVAQTCRQLAVLYKGALLFGGSVYDFTQTARGVVWQIASADPQSFVQATVVGSVQNAAGTMYRVLAATQPHATAQAAEPTLEDAYLWQLQQQSN
ncbi:MAG: ABC transporter ATP-binding protein [Blastochloris sp.]|nr:ABC transporter ATP-binding protein [Blastochloris sp.]